MYCEQCTCAATSHRMPYPNISGLVIDFATHPVRTGNSFFVGGGKVQGARCKLVKCEVPVRGINARRQVICEAGMCEEQRTTGAAGVVIGCEPLKRN